ncbi:hypothetical protein PR001_g30293 [Phytophthora rubi]|uniref:Uncharacterized protein n=1 Tax=Phytophthora rubi TaxID=129364 RepID=A0A6A3GUF1_9STRA|nr:hypothetical protein PR001_g30293 [Phytophthora rubi]
MAWRRMLRDARRGRELAQRVRDELADRLAGVVMGAGGQIDTAGLINRLEATFTAEVNAAVPLPPAVPASAAVPAIAAVSTPAASAPAPAASGSGTRTGSLAATTGSTTGTSSSLGPSGSHSAPTPPPTSPPSGSRRSRSGAPSRSSSQSRASGPSGAAPAPSSRSSPFRRSRRPSTVADTTASSRAAAQASSAATLSAAAAAAARAREDAALFGSESFRQRRSSAAGPVQASPVAWPWVSLAVSGTSASSFAVAFPHASASTIWFALALTFGFPGVDTFGGFGAFRAPGAAGALFAEGPQGSERGVRSWPRQFGRLQWRRLVHLFVVPRLVFKCRFQWLSWEFSSGALLRPRDPASQNPVWLATASLRPLAQTGATSPPSPHHRAGVADALPATAWLDHSASCSTRACELESRSRDSGQCRAVVRDSAMAVPRPGS